jgi:hypothetical protein
MQVPHKMRHITPRFVGVSSFNSIQFTELNQVFTGQDPPRVIRYFTVRSSSCIDDRVGLLLGCLVNRHSLFLPASHY